MLTQKIQDRYDDLASQTCCLSCGGAVNYAHAQPGETCLDLGSGRGTDVLRLAQEVGESGFVYGIDISQAMIEKARTTAAKTGISHVSFRQCQLEALDIASESVDVVISNCTLNHVSDKQQVWNEIFRVLKPHGRFVISDIYASQPVPEEYRNNPEAVAECWAGAATRTEYLRQIMKAGFKQVHILEESAPYEKGKISVSSITVSGQKSTAGCGCC